MFTNLAHRRRRQAVTMMVENEQLKLENLRYNNADDQLMQLHLDRMQDALNGQYR